MKRLIIICTGNSCRSQMAHGLLNSLNLKIEVYSAGTKPEKVNQFAVVAMNKIGIDISPEQSDIIKQDFFDYYPLVDWFLTYHFCIVSVEVPVHFNLIFVLMRVMLWWREDRVILQCWCYILNVRIV